MASYDYDLICIGGGSGGVRASRFAATNAGAKVAVIEMPYDPISSATKGGLGGTCVIRGCVPKKLFVYGSHFREEFEDCAGFGWTLDSPAKFDWSKMLKGKTAEIERLNGIYGRMLANAGVEVIYGSGSLQDAHTVEVDNLDGSKKSVTAKHILIATGGTASKLNIPGAELGITSDEALAQPTLPKKTVILGGGYIAVEFAGIFCGYGSETHIVFRQPTPLRGFDEDVRGAVHENLKKRGVHVHSKLNPVKIEKTDEGLVLYLDSGDTITGLDCVMFATGRRPNTHRPDLNLAQVGVEMDSAGAIKVDEFSRTNVEGVWAIGDVTNRINLTPVALMEGSAMVQTCFQNTPTAPDYAHVPSAVFCQPPAATCGLTEQEAVEKGMTVDVYLASFKPMKGTLSGRDEKILMKCLVDVQTDKVVGMHMVGPDAAEIMQGMGVAMKCGCTKKQLDSTVGIHPSTAEEFVTMRTPTRRVGPGAEEAK
mmetsp:Transcript_28753/g.39745  ORF Transcript_28753/g.39745 Transcript_28753/m.39745 type:complete len:481 (+) Transcript_28753:38-1480(+)|eukprot:CAMPEP_0196581922 /NCGR_PEP_ID=MMETSP1081-20130531/36518_1 /TAXON_ID=36882 /ORGANISM="Pyramimonas amylifera, Strain CCMP720" /LENGTH=480 /DNA_ID=CAMNT_0041902331 /DNA_START=27 /DNA_END=1469 /DNA_ORIENTATION=+